MRSAGSGNASADFETDGKIRDRFLIGRPAQFTIAGAHPVIASWAGQPGLAEMIGQHLGFVRHHVRKALFERVGRARMPVTAPRQQQALIGGVPHQRVLEAETLLQASAFGKDDTGRIEACQCTLKFWAALGRDRFEQRKSELPADDGGDLRDLARLAEAVQACHQRILERCRHRGAVLARGFQHAFRQFLREQRHAVGLGDDRGNDFRRQAVRGGNAGDQRRAFGAAQSAQRQQSRMGPRQPGRCEIRPRHDDGKQARLRDTVRYARQHFERRRVDPMRVFDDEEHRLGFAQANDLLDKKRNGRCLSLCRRQRYGGCRCVRQREQFRQQRNRRRVRCGPL